MVTGGCPLSLCGRRRVSGRCFTYMSRICIFSGNLSSDFHLFPLGFIQILDGLPMRVLCESCFLMTACRFMKCRTVDENDLRLSRELCSSLSLALNTSHMKFAHPSVRLLNWLHSGTRLQKRLQAYRFVFSGRKHRRE